MSWSRVAPDLYQRPIGPNEIGYMTLIAAEQSHPREMIRIHTFADIVATSSSQDTVSAFRTAWKALRLLKSPDIATMFQGQYNQYKIPSDQELEEWLNRTFKVAPSDTATTEVVREMQLRREHLPVCYLVPRTTTAGTFAGTIILFLSHWRTEASGCYQMIGDICDFATDLMTGTKTQQALVTHARGSETKLLVPTLAEIVMPGQDSSPESKARIEAHFENYYAHLPSVDLTLQADATTPFSHVMLSRHTYTSSATSAVVTACKAEQITVTAAIHAAYIGAVWDLAPVEKQSRAYASLMPAQVRARLQTSSPYRDNGCWNAAQLMMLVVPAGQDFRSRAKSLRQQYGLAGQKEWWFEDAHAVADQTNAMGARLPPEPSALPFFTSLGVIDRTILAQSHGIVEVRNIWGWADPMSTGCVLTMWTFGERLNVQITWNAAYHSESQIETILDSIDRTLAKELNIETGGLDTTNTVY